MAADEPLIAHAGPFKLPGNGGGTLTWDERQEIKSFTGVSAAVRDRKQTGGVRHLTLSGPVQNMSTAKKMAMEFVLRSQIASVPFVATPKANGDWEATERQPSKKQATSSSNGSSSNLTWQQGMHMQHGGMPAMFQGHMPMQWPPGMMMPMQYPGMPMQYPGLPPPSMMMPMHMPMMYPPPQKEVAPETSDDDDVVDDEWCSNHLGSTAKAAGATAALKPTWGVPAKVLQEGTGNFIDEEDLKEKYAKKPLQLAAIMKNTKRFRDPVRECTLFEDVKFTAVVSNEQRVETEKKRTMTQDREKKRAKKAKSEEGGKAAKVEPGEPKPFTESQTKAVAKFIESTGSYYIKLGEAITVVEAEGLGDFMNAKFMTSVQGCHCKIKEALAEFTVAKDNNAGSLPALKALHTAIKEQSAQSIRRLTLQTDEAKALKAEEEE